MVRTVVGLFAACLSGCFFVSDDPSLGVHVDTNGLLISVSRGPDHAFGQVRATVNGVDAGLPQYTPGREGTLNAKEVHATASFLVPQAQIGASLHVEIDDDGALYTLDVPDFGAPRTPTVLTPLDVTLHHGDWVEVTTGIAGDRIQRGMVARLASGPECFTWCGTDIGDRSTKFQVPPELDLAWTCYGTPIPTDIPLAIKLDFPIEVAPAITTCAGPALTCDPIVGLFLPTVTFDATVEL